MEIVTGQPINPEHKKEQQSYNNNTNNNTIQSSDPETELTYDQVLKYGKALYIAKK